VIKSAWSGFLLGARVWSQDSRMENSISVGVALSGGGHRATAFGLGVLLYLADCRASTKVTTISSVSGGSLLNSYVALLDRPFNQLSAAEFDERAAVLASRIAGRPNWWAAVATFVLLAFLSLSIWALSGHAKPFVPMTVFIGLLLPCALVGARSGGSVWGWWGTWLYCGLLAEALLLGLEAYRLGHGDHPALAASGLVALLLLVGWAVGQRHVITGIAFGKTMCPPRQHRPTSTAERRVPKLEDMASDVRHVMCATEMHAGQHAYFSHDLIYSRGFGLGRPGGLPVRAAVQCSANFPGGFPLRALRTRRFDFRLNDGRGFLSESSDGLSEVPNWMVLSDGGVFDNLADAWFLEGADRASRLDRGLDARRRLAYQKRSAGGNPDTHPNFTQYFYRKHRDLVDRIESIRKAPDCVIVVNAGTSVPWSAVRRASIPYIGEALGFVKIADVMYRNTTAVRARDLSLRFQANKPLGLVVDMADGPDTTIDGYLNSPSDGGVRAERISRLIKTVVMEKEPPFMTMDLKASTAAVPTTLQPLGVRTTASLLYHGYLQAMLGLHIEFDFPLLDPYVNPEAFVRLAQGQRRQSVPDAYGPNTPGHASYGDIGRARALVAETRVALSRGRVDDAKRAASNARTFLAENTVGVDVQAAILEVLGHVAVSEGVLDRARNYYEHALSTYRFLQDRIGEANTLRGLGDLDLKHSSLVSARERYHGARALQHSTGDRAGEAYTVKGLGDVEAALGAYVAAILEYQHALMLYDQAGDVRGLAATYEALGSAFLQTKEIEDARKALHNAHEQYLALGDAEGATRLAKLIADCAAP